MEKNQIAFNSSKLSSSIKLIPIYNGCRLVVSSRVISVISINLQFHINTACQFPQNPHKFTKKNFGGRREMKRSLNRDVDDSTISMKKTKIEEEEEEEEEENSSGFIQIDEDLLFEILKHVDSKSLARAACVNKQWHRTAEDERLWEMICTRHWGNTGSGNQQQLRSVVLALGGFRRLHSLYLWPLLMKPPSSSSSSSVLYNLNSNLTSSSPSPSSSSLVIPQSNSKGKMPTHWGKDEVHLSLSLLSIRYYERMNVNRRRID